MQTQSRHLIVAVALSVFGLTALAGPDSHTAPFASVGKWTLNVEKSKADTGALVLKSETRMYEDWGGGVIHGVFEGIDSQGQPLYREYAARFDGKDYPWVRKGSPSVYTQSFKRINNRTAEFTSKRDGQVYQTGKTTVSPDGKTMTITYKATTAQGEPISGTLVFDKQ
ncbi:MAG: hypothetical protein M3R62_03135 [Acidobacteriota bacterium]|nr:hypothetical protein [Acidobacteriota bacterium]